MVFPEFATPADGASHAAEASIKIAIAGIEKREVRSRARTKMAIVPPRCLVIAPRLTPVFVDGIAGVFNLGENFSVMWRSASAPFADLHR